MSEEGSDSRSRWERLEEYLYDHEKAGTTFSSREYADTEGLDPEEASRDIQRHLEAQRRKGSKTLFLLQRVPGSRTSAAEWMVGARTLHVRHLQAGFFDDTLRKVQRALLPDLRRLREINPRAATRIEEGVEGLEGAMKVLAVATNSAFDDLDDEGDDTEDE
jgi:hypothetical protein